MEGSYERRNKGLEKKQYVGDGESIKGEKNSWVSNIELMVHWKGSRQGL